MELFYSKFNEKKFKIFTILGCLIGDLVLCRYLWIKIADKNTFNKSSELVASMLKNHPSLQGQEIPVNFFNEMYQMVLQTLMLMLGLFVLLHLVVYVLHWHKRQIAHTYIKGQAWFLAVGFIWMGIVYFGQGLFEAYFILQGLIYFLVARGMNIFPNR